MRYSSRLIAAALMAGFAWTGTALHAQKPAPAAPAVPHKEGKLDASIDTEADDVPSRLEAMRHEQYLIQQQLYTVQFNQAYGDRVRMEQLLYPNHDGDLTPAFVFTSRNAPAKPADRSKPALVVVHGGYHGNLDNNMFAFLAAAVERGYVVIFPEYRGSRGYGKAQYDAVDFGGKEVDDVVAAAEFLTHFYPEVDPKRMGIYGRSKGGMITLLAIERFPKVFAAAVHNVGLVDMVAYMAYKPPFRGDDVAKQPRFGGKTPSQDLAPYIDVSPINHIDKIEVPVLVQATTGDRTAPSQLHAERLIDALKARGKVYEAKIYDRAPGGHLFAQARSTEALDATAAAFAFLDKYVKR